MGRLRYLTHGVILGIVIIATYAYLSDQKPVRSEYPPEYYLVKAHIDDGEYLRISAQGLVWPVVGPISQCYCPWHPLGIDIDGYALPDAPIKAATDGTVVFAGGNPCCEYGYYVEIISDSFSFPSNRKYIANAGIETLYGHLSKIDVKEGQRVYQGQEIGIIGSTGKSTGRHLHFEVIDNGYRKNPLDYLAGHAVCEPGQKC